MDLVFNGVDISTEKKFISYIKDLNKSIMESNAIESKTMQKPYDIDYMRKRYRRIVAKNKKAEFMAEYDCYKCIYFQRLARKCQANCDCILENTQMQERGAR